MCARRNVTCVSIDDLNAPEFLEPLKRHRPDVIVSLSCPQIRLAPLIALPVKGLLSLVGALVPQERYGQPCFWINANGEAEAGVSIYLAKETMEAGILCAQRIFKIAPEESLDQFLHRSQTIAADLLLRVLWQLQRDQIERLPLNQKETASCSWPDKQAVRRFRAAGHQLW